MCVCVYGVIYFGGKKNPEGSQNCTEINRNRNGTEQNVCLRIY